jgi:hypothetical protein
MTNGLANTWPDDYGVVVMGCGSPITAFGFLTCLLLLGYLVVTLLRWALGKTKDKDPTNLVAACLVQFAAFQWLVTITEMCSMTGSLTLGLIDQGFWLVGLAELLGGILADSLLCLFCSAVACLAARRLPRLPMITVLPILIIIVDIAVSLQWITFVLYYR